MPWVFPQMVMINYFHCELYSLCYPLCVHRMESKKLISRFTSFDLQQSKEVIFSSK